MTQNLDENVSAQAVVWRTPGHLLAPFGWAKDALAAMVEAKPALLINLFELDRTRMHLIALAFAHVPDVSPDLSEFLVRGSVRVVTEQVLGHYPTGMKRALNHLPSSVLSPDNYRRLVKLLADPRAAKLLYHAKSIEGSLIELLDGLPAGLRNPFMIGALKCYDPENAFCDGLRFLVSRGAAASFDSLVDELAAVAHSGQLYAKLRSIVEALPLQPNTLPPPQVGDARRIDNAVTIRSIAKNWRNCLAGYLGEINAGTCAIYFCEHSDGPAACLVRRYSRLGWFLQEVKGPGNTNVEPARLAAIRSAFSEVGAPPGSVIAAIKHMMAEANVDGHEWIPQREQHELDQFINGIEELGTAEV